ncbi:ATP-dependent helicase HrpB, partial [Rhodobacteraceae bacterium]|nr:ATP-dependent helicase HrpB [Paracoccaceae bacterium]
RAAAPLAALLADRDPLRGAGADVGLRLEALASRERNPGLERIRTEAKRLAKTVPETKIGDPAEQAALAYPDRVALRRKGDDPRWLLSGGKGVKMDAGDALAGQRLLVITDTDGHPTEAKVRGAVPISEISLRAIYGDRIGWHQSASWSRREGRVETTEEERFGAIALSNRRWKDAPSEAVATAMLEGVRQLGLVPSPGADRFRARVGLVRAAGRALPDMSDAALIETLEDWLLPHLARVRSASQWRAFDILPALRAMLDWDAMQVLDRETPAHFETPLGRNIPIDYGNEDPGIELRLQEIFGTTRHPVVAGRPLRVTLLSPAGRPLQTTMDIPGFWETSYGDVRKDMRGRYPRHPWPEDPTVADPTLRAKRRR